MADESTNVRTSRSESESGEAEAARGVAEAVEAAGRVADVGHRVESAARDAQPVQVLADILFEFRRLCLRVAPLVPATAGMGHEASVPGG